MNTDTPVIMLTANVVSGAEEEYMKLGFAGYLSKPIRGEDLEAALIKYLPERWAEGLRMDIFCNLSRDFEGDPAYDLYVKLKRGEDPQRSKEHIDRLYRLADGTDDTSITYL